MNKMRVFIWLIALIGFSACQSKSGQTTEQENVDSLTVAPTEEEKTITGVEGDASMHYFMLVTLEGDTLYVSTMAQEPGRCQWFRSSIYGAGGLFRRRGRTGIEYDTYSKESDGDW